MSARYSASYIDAIFARAEASAVHTVISVLSRNRALPKECILFVRVYEWIGADWQYYERLKPEDYEEMSALLTEFGMTDVLDKFREAMSAWRQGDDSIHDVDEWANQRRDGIEKQLLRHAERVSSFLKE